MFASTILKMLKELLAGQAQILAGQKAIEAGQAQILVAQEGEVATLQTILDNTNKILEMLTPPPEITGLAIEPGPQMTH